MVTLASRIFTIIKKSYSLIRNSNPLLLSGATAFFTTFAIAPILIILSHFLDLFFDNEALPKLFTKLATVFGKKATHDIEHIVENFLSFETSTWVTIALSIFFYFVATTLLSVIRQSIHQLWGIRKKSSKKISYPVKERIIEIAMILLIAALFVITLVINFSLTAFQALLGSYSDVTATIFVFILDVILSMLVVSAWFTMLFRFMVEAHVRWKVALAGGIFTGILFNFGKFTLTKILVDGEIQDLFGPSSSIALILLFIFYCSFILYFGASFTYEYAKAIRHPILPGKQADTYNEEISKSEMGRQRPK